MLTITTATTLETLADRCAEVLRVPAADPFVPEWIATPTGSVRGWLTRRLAEDLGATAAGRRDGVVANVDFVRSGTLFRRLRGIGPKGSATVDDPWSSDAMTWRLMEMVATGAVARDGSAPASGGTGDVPSGRIEPLAVWAARQARRFDRYHAYRPDLIRAWVGGDDAPRVDQARLYRELVARIPVPNPVAAIDAWLAGAAGAAPDLPWRLAFFGFTLAPEGNQFVDVVERLARDRDVDCYFLDPAPGLDPSARGGLTATWGRDDIAASRLTTVGDRAVWHVEPPESGALDSVLGRLQRVVATGDGEPRDLADGDDSVVVHDCHGLTRQVEVLRDEILHRLVRDETLREEDIVVLCADPEAVAPVIMAVLGDSARSTDEGTDATRTPKVCYHIDGLPYRDGNPVAEAFGQLLEMVTGRVTSLDLVNFCQLEAVRTRWGFDDDDIERFRTWASRLNVRWGIDPDHRARFDIPASLTMGTWMRALDRLALGAAYASDGIVAERAGGPIAPSGIEGDDVERAGLLREVLVRIRDLADVVDRVLPAEQWVERLTAVVRDLFAPASHRPEQLDDVVARCRIPDAAVADPTFGVSLRDLRPHLLGGSGGRAGSSARFRGGVTFTTPDAARGVPHRVVALLDLGDHWIPAGTGDGGDLMAIDFQPGDPEARRDARASLLAAIAAAGEALVVTRDAKSLTTNAELPEGVIVGELFDALAACCSTRPGTDHRRHVVEGLSRTHSRQAVDPGNFAGDRPWSFDVVACTAAQAARGSKVITWPVPGDTPVGRRLVAPTPGGVVRLDDLCAFLRDATRFVVTDTLGARVPRDEEALADALPTALDGLERYGLRRRVLTSLEDGVGVGGLLGRLRAADDLPVGSPGDVEFATQTGHVRAILAAAGGYARGRHAADLTIDVPLADGRRLVGHVACRVDDEIAMIIDSGVSRDVKLGERLRALTLLDAAVATTPDPSFGDPDTRDWWTIVVRYHPETHVARFHQTLERSEGRRDAARGRLQALVGLLDLTRIGAVPLPTPYLGMKGTFGKSWQTAYREEFVRHGEPRLLYGYRPVEAFRNLHPHPDDPVPTTPVDHDRADALRSVLVDDVFGAMLGGIRAGNATVKAWVDAGA